MPKPTIVRENHKAPVTRSIKTNDGRSDGPHRLGNPRTPYQASNEIAAQAVKIASQHGRQIRTKQQVY